MATTAVKVRGLSRRHGLLLALGALVLVIAGGAPYAHADTSPPTVQVTAPAAGSTLSGVVSVAATASSPIGIDRVEFSYFDGATGKTYPLGTDTSAPYTACFDTTKVPNTAPLNATVYATAYDTGGEFQQHTKVGNGVTVSN